MNKEEFIIHRAAIANEMIDNSCLVLFTKPNPMGEINRNFYYATGIKEYDDILVIEKINGKVSEHLFIQPYDEFKAKWTGRTLFKEEAMELSGIKDIRYVDTFERFLLMTFNMINNVYFDFGLGSGLDSLATFEQDYVAKIKSKCPFVNVLNASSIFRHVRTVKSNAEIDKIKEAISITNKGLQSIMSNLKPGMYEYQIESFFDGAIKYNGATGYAFPTIAASGENGCCLHYGANNCVINDGDLVLFDLGSSKDGYCSDISRTFPANGKFSERQKQIYNIVLGGQELMFKTMRPGITTQECNKVLVGYFAEKLMEIGLIKDPSEVSKYYYHGVSHHMGMDCHDMCEYTPLKPGCVISNEPGLYIAEEKIGIRIEDDVLITEDGCINLSSEIIKTVEDIEAFMAKGK